jgi:PBSX family phage terminase large subunit
VIKLIIFILLAETFISYPISSNNPNGDPLPTQEAFHKSNAKFRMLAGGWGTGKTTALCIEMLKDVAIKNNYILLGRKDLPELKSTTLKEFLEVCPEGVIVNHNKTDRFIKCVNGTEIFYTNLDESKDAIKKINSLNLGSAYIDQAEELTENLFTAIKGRLRRPNTRRNFCGALNPEGHNWIWRDFKEKPIAESALFTATTLENVYLPEDYVRNLLNMPEKWVKRYVYCSWEDFEGLCFGEWREDRNKIGIYEPHESEQHIHILDYGFRNPTCILYAAIDCDGIVRVYDEYYQSGRLISESSESYKQNKYWKKAIRIADPSINKTERDGKNVKSEFLANGIHWLEADNDVRQGINNVNQLFKDGRLLISENCVNTIAEIGAYKWKEIRPGQETNEYEEPVKKGDHACDNLRYLSNWVIAPAKKEPVVPIERPRFRQDIYTGSEFSRFD